MWVGGHDEPAKPGTWCTGVMHGGGATKHGVPQSRTSCSVRASASTPSSMPEPGQATAAWSTVSRGRVRVGISRGGWCPRDVAHFVTVPCPLQGKLSGLPHGAFGFHTHSMWHAAVKPVALRAPHHGGGSTRTAQLPAAALARGRSGDLRRVWGVGRVCSDAAEQRHTAADIPWPYEDDVHAAPAAQLACGCVPTCQSHEHQGCCRCSRRKPPALENA